MGLGNIFAHTKLYQIGKQPRKVEVPSRSDVCCLGQLTVRRPKQCKFGFLVMKMMRWHFVSLMLMAMLCYVRILYGCFIDFLAWNSGHLV